jgi:transposase-like protein
MRGRTHTREFKLEVCRQIEHGEKRPAQICREHELANSLLLRWRKEYAQYGEGAFLPGPRTDQEAMERKVAELERFCGQLALENAVLKKALEAVKSRSDTR